MKSLLFMIMMSTGGVAVPRHIFDRFVVCDNEVVFRTECSNIYAEDDGLQYHKSLSFFRVCGNIVTIPKDKACYMKGTHVTTYDCYTYESDDRCKTRNIRSLNK